MPSFSGKLEMLLESYEQSKRSPAYKELRAKYKALKQTHHEILAALVSISQNIVVRDDESVALTKQERRELKKARRQAESEERDCDSEETIANIISNLAKTSIETEPVVQRNDSDSLVPAEMDPDEFDEICAEEEEMEELQRANEVLPDEFEEDDCAEITVGDEEIEEEETEEEEIEVEDEEVEVVEEETEEIEVEEVEVEEVEVEEVEVVEEETEEEEIEVEEVEVEEEEDEEAGVYEIERNGKRYFTTNEQDGIVYEAVGEDDVGDEIGKFVKGKLVLNKTK
jgi:hypothetical protein